MTPHECLDTAMQRAQSWCVRLADSPTLDYYALDRATWSLLAAHASSRADVRVYVEECMEELDAVWARKVLETSYKPREPFVPAASQFWRTP